MTKKYSKKFLKNLLATASTLAVITCSNSVLAGSLTNTKANDIEITRNTPIPYGTGAHGNLTNVAYDGDSFFLSYDGTSLFYGIDLATFDLNNQSPLMFILENSSFSSIISTGGGTIANLEVADNKVLTLNDTLGKKADNTDQPGGIFTALGNINLGGMGGGGASLNINSNATLGGNINSQYTVDGVVNVLANRTVTFNGELGGAGAIGGAGALATVNVADASTVNLHNNATFAAGGGFALTGLTTTLNVTKDAAVITGTVDTAADNQSELKFAEGAHVTGAVGDAHPLALVQLNGDGGGGLAKVVTFDALVKTVALNVAGAKTKAQLGGGATIDTLTIGNAASSVNIANNQALIFTGNVANIDLSGNNSKITFATADAELDFNTVVGKDVVITFGNVDPGAVGKGTIVFNAANAEITAKGGLLGHTNALDNISVKGDKLVTLNSAININTDTLQLYDGAKLLATDASAGSSNTTYIGVGSSLEYKPLAAGAMNIRLTHLEAADSSLKLSNADTGANTIFTLTGNLVADDGAGTLDELGIVEVNATGHTLTIAGGNSIGAANNKRLASLIISGDKAVTINPSIFAKAISLNSTAITTLGEVNTGVGGTMTFAKAGRVNLTKDVTANIDFDNLAGTVFVVDDKTITGTIDSTGADNNKGTIIFDGKGKVTEAIGGTKSALLVQLNGTGGEVVTFDKLVKTATLDVAGVYTQAQLNGGAEIDTLTIGNLTSIVNINDTKALTFTGNATAIDLTGSNSRILFAGADSELEFNSIAGKALTVSFDPAADFAPAATGNGVIIFNAAESLVVNGKSLGTAAIIGAGAAPAVKFKQIRVSGTELVTLNTAIVSDLLSIDNGAKLLATNVLAGSSALTLIGNASEVEYKPTANMNIGITKFTSALSTLKLTASGGDRTFTLAQDINPGAADKGIIILNGEVDLTDPLNPIYYTATLDAAAADTKVGIDGGNTIDTVQASGKTVIAANIDLSGTKTLKADSGANLNVLTNTAFDVPVINIGEIAGAATVTMDTQKAAAIDMLDAKIINFEHADSLLKITNSDAAGADSKITLKGSLTPHASLVAAADGQGKVEINATGKGITINSNGVETIGTASTKRFQSLTISGTKDITINPSIFAKDVIISSTGDTKLNKVDCGLDSSITFAADGNLTIGAEAAAIDLDFANHKSTLTIAPAADLEFNTISNGANAEILFAGSGGLILNGAKTVVLKKISALNAANAQVAFAGGTYTVPEIQVLNADAGSKLTLDDGFNITGGFNLTGGLAGNVTFAGNAVIGGRLGTYNATPANNRPLGAVTVDGANKTLEVKNGVNVASLDATTATNKLRFSNVGDVEVRGTVGTNAAFNVIEFNTDHKVDFKDALSTNGKTLDFIKGAEVVTTGYDLADTTITNTGGKADASLTVDKTQNITGDVANFGPLKVKGDNIVNINSGLNQFSASIAPLINNQVTINVNSGNFNVPYIGTSTEKAKKVVFNVSGTVGEATHANEIVVNAAGVITTFYNVLDVKTMNFTDATSEAKFYDLDVNAALKSTGGSGNGIVTLHDSNIKTDIGSSSVRLSKVTLENYRTNQISQINGDIHADNIEIVKGSTFQLMKEVTFDGASTIDTAKISLGSNDIKFINGETKFTGATTLVTTINGAELGNLVVGANGIISTTGKINVEINPSSVIPANGQQVKLIRNDGGRLNLTEADVSVTKNGGRFESWQDSIVNGELYLTNNSQVAAVMQNAVNLVGDEAKELMTPEIYGAYNNLEAGSQAAKAFGEFNITAYADAKEDAIALVDGIERLTYTNGSQITAVGFNNMASAGAQINSRLTDVSSLSIVPNTNNSFSTVKQTSSISSGISAGENFDRYGIWVSPFYSSATQKKKARSAGFKADTYGGTFGFDTKANDDMLVGLAVTAMHTDIKHKDFKSGDKTKIETMLFSAYTNYQFGNNWFGQGVFSVGTSHVDGKENRRLGASTYLASSKYNSMTFATDIAAGYNHFVNDQLIVTPTLGFGYSRINDTSFKEQGASNQHQLNDITKGAAQKFDIVAGLRVSGLPFMVGKLAISPELHGSVRHDLIGKAAKVNAKLAGRADIDTNVKPERTNYNVGASLKTSYGMMEYGVSADASFAKKYRGVNGSINLRVNF